MKIAFKTFGCKANSLDTDALHLEALRRGFEIVSEDDWADAYVINSCTVTERADREARYQVGRFKRQNPEAMVGMVGCYSQVNKEEVLKINGIDFVVGTGNKFRVLDHLRNKIDKETVERDQVESAIGFLPEYFPGSRNARASVKIQDGCNYRCSFCIIPQARGRSRSLSPEAVAKQVREAYQQGFQEVVLTGIHLAHYGWDQQSDLQKLMKQLLKGDGPRLRVSSLDPFELPDDLIAMTADEKRFCPHFHIALQSGSERILKSMRRLYKAHEFVDVTRKIERANPDTFIGVDVIVGFPGEGEEEFQETVKCLEDSFWAKLHVFPFSLRKGTAAESLANPVSTTEITNRSQVLRDLSDRRHKAFLRSQIGKKKEVLLERPSKRKPGFWFGHTENYLPTCTPAETGMEKTIITSRMEALEGERLRTLH